MLLAGRRGLGELIAAQIPRRGELEHMRLNSVRSCKYEWMFWT